MKETKLSEKKYSTEDLIQVVSRTIENYHAGLYPDLEYIDESALLAIIAKLRAADALREAAGKVDKKASIDAINGYFSFLYIHGFTKEDPLIVSVMALIESLPDKEEK